MPFILSLVLRANVLIDCAPPAGGALVGQIGMNRYHASVCYVVKRRARITQWA